MSAETVILQHMIDNEGYTRRVLPHIKEEYFSSEHDKVLFQQIKTYFAKFGNPPTPTALRLAIDKMTVNEEAARRLVGRLDEISAKPNKENDEWLMATTEQFCKDRAIFNALFDAIAIVDEKEKSKKNALSPDSIPELLRRALAVSFDSHIGHDWGDDVEKRHDLMHANTARIPFHLDLFNEVTNGGMPRKTLGVVVAPPGGGKSIFLCDYAANCLKQGYNVLYITLEMAEEKIAERIDANLLNIKINELSSMTLPVYKKRVDRFKECTKAKLIIKEYGTGTASCAHFESLIHELKIKKQFAPDVVIIDYLGICAAAQYKMGAQVNSFDKFKAIAEEMRALGKTYNVQVFTAAQINRSGYTDSDANMGQIAESVGINNTADFMFFIFQNEELIDLNQVTVNLWKNRLGSKDTLRRFVIGLDKEYMRFYNLNSNAQPAPRMTVAEKTNPFTQDYGSKPPFATDDGGPDADIGLGSSATYAAPSSKAPLKDRIKQQTGGWT